MVVCLNNIECSGFVTFNTECYFRGMQSADPTSLVNNRIQHDGTHLYVLFGHYNEPPSAPLPLPPPLPPSPPFPPPILASETLFFFVDHPITLMSGVSLILCTLFLLRCWTICHRLRPPPPRERPPAVQFVHSRRERFLKKLGSEEVARNVELI